MTRLVVKRGDITREVVDAIVNAANESLAGGGGVDGAIHRAAGDVLRQECARIRRQRGPCACPTGDAVLTAGGDLPAPYVIHTVGPVWNGGGAGEPELLRSCYWRSLEVARENGLRTVSFPCISTGIFGYPPELAAPLAVQTVREFTEQHPDSLEEVRFVVFSDADERLYAALL